MEKKNAASVTTSSEGVIPSICSEQVSKLNIIVRGANST
jgi:hypothetical protein